MTAAPADPHEITLSAEIGTMTSASAQLEIDFVILRPCENPARRGVGKGGALARRRTRRVCHPQLRVLRSTPARAGRCRLLSAGGFGFSLYGFQPSAPVGEKRTLTIS